MIARFFSFCSTLLFPARCIGCRKKEEVLCARCLSVSRKTLTTPFPYIISFFDFKEPLIRRAIHAIKYYHRRDLVIPLVRSILPEVQKIPHIATYTIIPIPMPGERKLLRGYNQAELIASCLGKELSLPVRSDILKRKISPLRQVRTRTRTDRIKNQKGSFVVEEDMSAMRIILVDDVTTTGATIEEARGTLLSRKAAHVLAVTLAH